ncbi:MAG: dNTP triphosphohydrolase [Candidatus Brocadia sp.]|nr:dNTP triphosphohydrolase [Candidatus Brocadia sp.]
MDWQQLISKKRIHSGEGPKKGTNDPRSEFERDFDRISFSYPFRRLQDKTQTIPLPKYDFIHTRLTHSLETSSVGRSLGRIVGKYIINNYNLKDINEHDFGAIVSSACLAHDIGNPPFGHAEEKAMSDFFRTTGSHIKAELNDKNGDVDKLWNDFVDVEGNALGFHTITKKHYRGFDLTLTALAAFTKYTRESKINNINTARVSQKKYGFFYADREIFKNIADELGLRSLSENKDDYTWCRHPLAFLTEAADDICYRLIDFEDGVRAGCIDFEKAEELLNEISGLDLQDRFYKELSSDNERLGYLRGKAIFNMIYDVADIFKKNEKGILRGDFDKALIEDSKYKKDTISKIADEVRKKVYESASVLELEATGFEVLGGLLHYFIGSGDSKKNERLSRKSFHWQKINELLPEQFKSTKNENLYNDILNIIDYVAGMSDSYAIKVYRKLK